MYMRYIDRRRSGRALARGAKRLVESAILLDGIDVLSRPDGDTEANIAVMVPALLGGLSCTKMQSAESGVYLATAKSARSSLREGISITGLHGWPRAVHRSAHESVPFGGAACKYRYCVEVIVSGECIYVAALHTRTALNGDSAAIAGSELWVKAEVNRDYPSAILSVDSACDTPTADKLRIGVETVPVPAIMNRALHMDGPGISSDESISFVSRPAQCPTTPQPGRTSSSRKCDLAPAFAEAAELGEGVEEVIAVADSAAAPPKPLVAAFSLEGLMLRGWQHRMKGPVERLLGRQAILTIESEGKAVWGGICFGAKRFIMVLGFMAPEPQLC